MQAVRAKRAEGLAQETIDGLVSIFDVADPFASQGTPFSADELLKRAQETAYHELSAHPGVQARLLESLGRVLRRRGKYTESAKLLQDAVDLRRTHAEFGGAALIPTLIELSFSEAENGNYARTEQLLNEAESMIHEHGLERSTSYARLLSRRGMLYNALGNTVQAGEQLETSLRLTRELEGPDSLLTAETLALLSLNHQWRDQLHEASSLRERRCRSTSA